jgi:recombination protein RecR
MTTFDKLVVYFEKFPGVGVRQAKRFAFHVLTMKREQVSEFSDLISSLSNSVTECVFCHRFFSVNNNGSKVCANCSDVNRDTHKLLVVASDNDIQAIERSGVYNGLYFVLGGTVPLMSKDTDQKLRSGALKALVSERIKENSLEVILGFAVNPDGENTARYVESLLGEFIKIEKVKISHLGRGLSTGSELEYADPETIKSALRNRV